MQRRPRRLRLPAPAAALAFLSSDYNLDSAACAMAVELGDPKKLVHGNHMAYGVPAWLAYQAARLVGDGGRELPILILLNALAGGAGAALLCRLLRRRGAGERRLGA